MVVAGWLTEAKVNRVATYSITDAGKRLLGDLERYLPLQPARGKLNPPADDQTRVAREIYVLSALFRAPHHTISKADLEVGFGGKGTPNVAELVTKQPHLAMFRDQSCLGLNPATTRAVLNELALRGDIQVHRFSGSESYALSPAGVESLKQLRDRCPVLPPLGKSAPASSESIRQGREAFLLLKLLQSAKYALWETDAAVGSYPKPLKLNHATAWKVRGELVREGHISAHWDGKEGSYTLTPSGKRYLATMPFDALGEVKIKGSALTDLLSAARENSTPAVTGNSTLGESRTHPALTAAQLEKAVMEIFDELLRGRFANIRMVPIHEIRNELATRFGPHSVSHAGFNELLLDLRRTDRVRLISIDDRSRATPDQLRDSVSAVGETFFYVEKANVLAQS
jgi:DNA-binding PadR family transcriptional regulator